MQLIQLSPTNTQIMRCNTYVFCVKGRPFACLVSPHLPTTTASLVDYRDTGLKMTDLQCSRFSYGGHKMQILGKICITVQCIHDGVSFGTFHIKGNVVLDLAKYFDTDCVAGSKMSSILMRGRSTTSSASSTTRSPSPPSTPSRSSPARSSAIPPKAKTSAPPARTPATPPGRTSPPPRPPPGRTSPPPTPPSGRTSPTPTTPPGFPTTPQYQGSPHHPCHNSPHLPVSLMHPDLGQMSPFSANLNALSTMFHDADVQPDLTKERLALFDCDVDGDIEVENDGKNNFYLTEGYVYRSGHGRDKCSRVKCLDTMTDVPNNCGFHEQFILPNWFQPCGSSCRGGYCLCLRLYDSYLYKYL